MLSAFAQRVRIALQETKVDYTSFEIDPMNKPAWFVEQVNPAGKVPAMSYGGPVVPPDCPSPDSVKLAESVILCEFIADLCPHSGLMPQDPMQRAQVRRFIDVVNTKFAPAIVEWFYRGASWDGIIEGAKELQNLLPNNSAFLVGDRLTIADIAFAPFYSAVQIMAEEGICISETGQPKAMANALKSPGLAKLREYANGLLARPVIKAAVDQERQGKWFKDVIVMARHQN